MSLSVKFHFTTNTTSLNTVLLMARVCPVTDTTYSYSICATVKAHRNWHKLQYRCAPMLIICVGGTSVLHIWQQRHQWQRRCSGAHSCQFL